MALFFDAGFRSANEAQEEGAFFSANSFTLEEHSSSFYVAALTGQTISVGAYQRRSQALSRSAQLRAVRRVSGGSAVFAGEGIIYMAVGLRDASVFLPAPRDRVLNRNVRGLLAGLSSAGHPTHYFGRDFVSVERKPAVYAAWTRTANGHVLLEFFIAANARYTLDTNDVAYPTHSSPPLLDKEPTTLRELWGREVTHEEITDRVVHRGYGKTYGLNLEERAPNAHDEVHASYFDSVEMDDDSLTWSSPREVPIGFISAGIRQKNNGTIEDARLAGDFFQDRAAVPALRDALVGARATPEELVRAINKVYGREGHVVEGVTSLNTVLDAFREVL